MAHTIRDFERHLGDAIRAARKEKGYTQQKLSSLSGVCQSTLNKLERVGYPCSFASLYNLADALDVTAHDLLPETSPDLVAEKAA